MAIFRGVGGSGDSSDNSFLQEVTAQANAASASATAAANSATSALNTELTSASFNTSDGVLTLTKQDGDTVTADLDGRFLTSYTETDPVFTAHVASGITATNISNWNTAYNNHITAVDYSGSTLTLTQQDGGTLTTTINGALGSTLVHSGSTKIEAISSGVTVTGDITVSGTVDGRDLATDGTKLDGIEANATADQTGSEIKSAYEAVADTNAFTDAEKTKLSGIEASATADQTDAEIKTAYENNADTNAYTDAEKTKLSGIEASADVTDATNVTSAGAAMLASSPTFTGTITAPNVDISTTGSVTTNIATGNNNNNTTDVKVVNIGTGYGSGFFAGDSTTINIGSQATSARNIFNLGSGVSVSGKEDTINLKGNVEVTGNITGFIDIRNFYYSLSHQMGSSQSLTTTFTTVGADSQYTHSGLGTKTIDVSLDILYFNVSYTNDAELRFVMTAPNPATESTVNLGNVVASSTPSSYQTNLEVSGDFTKHFSKYVGLAKSSDGTNSLGIIYKYYYDGANDRTVIQMSTQASPPSVGSPIYLHPFDWESSGTDVISPVYQVDFTTDASVVTRRDYNEHLGYFTSSVAVKTQMRESTTSENVTINEMRGKLTRVGN